MCDIQGDPQRTETVQPEEQHVGRRLIADFSWLRGGYRENRARFLKMHRETMGGNRRSCSKGTCDEPEEILHIETIKHQNRSQKGCGISSLEDVQNLTGPGQLELALKLAML